MDSIELIDRIKNRELKLGDFVYVDEYLPLVGEKRIGTLRYNGVELLGLDEFDTDLLTSDRYSFEIKSQDDVLDILDTTEKRYLNKVLSPYKQRIEYIQKVSLENYNLEYILIELRKTKNHPHEMFTLPYFKKGTMYKNMKSYEKYSFERIIKF